MNGRSFPERSNLAWTRTAIELALVSMLLLRWACSYGWWGFLLIGILLALCAGIALTQRTRYRETRRSVRRDDTSPKTASVLTVTATLVLIPLPGGVEPAL